MGEEAMDIRFGNLIARMEAGIPVVQVKRGKAAKIKEMFKRDFWMRPLSTRMLGKKLAKMFGVDTEEDDG